MSRPDLGPCPPRFVEIKKEIAASYPNFQERVTKAWNELLVDLDKVTTDIAKEGTDYVPQVDFSEIGNLSPERVEEVRRKGSVVIRNVVDDAEATSWREWLQEYVTKNPGIEGFPADDKQFFQLYWTKSQVRARGHPNVLAVTSWLNNMYHVRSGAKIESVDLNTPLTYADRFRIRHPGVQWDAHPPHVDGGGIERWEDPTFRKCFEDLLSGDWRNHDPYDLENRINARSSMYGRVGQATVFRTYQGWLAVSETGPHEGTLQVFPNVFLSNAYTILRPFFVQKAGTEDSTDPKNWEYDVSSSDFPGVYSTGTGFRGPWPNTKTHPHLRLDETMVSVPKVNPGDMVFWHCDVVHAVEKEHTGKGDSAVMYIPAVPLTPQNAAYVSRQKENFVKGIPPPDFPPGHGEGDYAGVGRPDDLNSPVGKRAMGFSIEVA
ncbi:hypothetical protein POSPLADRAFT_1184529 [Postia placenta MAD-698-R-SB12]|uniref:DUF1479 domain protein n=1 Tax=Postia placenta MAD-698-R-SB12 TaxID=670580 RepID=A0A1X6MRN0_9APHY|nr:hypothetical protein POSPLADRAFT_1184529 [Postia placenta MAD-698-R-SB12]OSX58833.1 hypothetical protein POSPLADRAFT_1184529 [Postia placenta MAD-698-R-SB12]